ncbi:hypothetical protein ACF09C_17990 [Streptomyces sp. NPDC014870]|uniref:hypothetical protein n=1 Tax=Streptomyces sp. NPDC014870 TaxID=3364925 RepID=UPI003700006D
MTEEAEMTEEAAMAEIDDRPRPEECARVLAAAFDREPATAWITGGSERVRHSWFATTLRTHATLPGARRHLLTDGAGTPLAAAVLTPPRAAPGAAARAGWAAHTLARCGPRALGRTLRYLSRTEEMVPEGAWTLEFVGVVRRAAGRGVGRRILDHVLDAVDAVDGEEGTGGAGGGVFLTTADPVNVGLYRHFGFTVLGDVRVGPVVTTAMWRPGRAP